MIAHVWSSGEALTLDPASGVRGDQVVTTKYNDFPNLHWLGNKPASHFQLHSREQAGRWVCVEARAKLNTPEQRDGRNQLWIDGRLEAEVAEDPAGVSIVWQSKELTDSDRVRVGTDTGRFVGSHRRAKQLEAPGLYFVRVRQSNQTGSPSPWGDWHQPFQTN